MAEGIEKNVSVNRYRVIDVARSSASSIEQILNEMWIRGYELAGIIREFLIFGRPE